MEENTNVETGKPVPENIFAKLPDQPPKEEWKEKSRVPVTQQQILLSQMVEAAGGQDAPIIENISDLFVRDELAIPPGLADGYPERSYKWLALDDLHELSSNGGMYVMVNRLNHPNAPEHLFDDTTGAIVFRGQNALAYCRRENVDAINKHILRDFDLRVRSVTDFGDRQYNDGAVVVEQLDAKAMQKAAGGYGKTAILDDTSPDFTD